MSAARLPPITDAGAFESFCLDLWKDVWGDPGAQKNGRSGQEQAGVDVFGKTSEGWIGVQCKEKDDLVRSKLTVGELETEANKARKFKPRLRRFIVATTSPRDVRVQERARQLSRKTFNIDVWSWQDITDELDRRPELSRQLLPRYWPNVAAVRDRRVSTTRLPRVTGELFGREAELAALDAAWADSTKHVVTLVAWGGVGKTSLVATWVAGLAARDYDGADYFDLVVLQPGHPRRGHRFRGSVRRRRAPFLRRRGDGGQREVALGQGRSAGEARHGAEDAARARRAGAASASAGTVGRRAQGSRDHRVAQGVGAAECGALRGDD